MSERPGKHARRRPDRADDLATLARLRLERTRPTRPGGWIPVLPAAEQDPPGPVRDQQPPVTPADECGPRPVRELLPPAVAERVPVGLRAALVAPSSRALAGLSLFVALGVLLAGWFLWAARPRGEPAPPLQRSLPASATPAPSSALTSPGSLVVHVAGAVRRPGVVELPAGSRVSDAVEAAGGATRRAELASVNLARPLVDGEQLVVLTKGQAAPPAAAGLPGGAGAGPSGGAGGLVDLNTASLDQLDQLPGVGPVLAQRILDWRAEHGRFASIDELQEVSGIGEARFAELRPLVRV